MTGCTPAARTRAVFFTLLATALAAVPVAAATPSVQRDAAGNRLEALTEQPAPAGTEAVDGALPWLCTADRAWCVRTVRQEDAAQLEVAQQVAGEAEPRLRYLPLAADDGVDIQRPWPFIVRMAPGIGAPVVPNDAEQAALQNVLVGVEREWSTAYSGGGASAGTLTLARLHHEDDGIQFDTVATLPVSGNAMIRACFSEADLAQRAQACHDEYAFSAVLALDPAGQGAPVLRFQTTATRFPAGVSRFEDSLAKGPLTAKDLRRETDRVCSYQRTLRLDGGRYVPDAPLPDCSEFTEL